MTNHHQAVQPPDDSSFSALIELLPESAAVEHFEKVRWPDGAYCPSCGNTNVARGNTKRKRPIWYCRGCDKQFTVTTGTVMEDTKLSLAKWLYAFHLLSASKHGMSSLQLSRMLHVSTRTAWHLSHRIREAMKRDDQFFSGEIVETDETYIGGRRKHVGKGYRKNKIAVQTIVSRSSHSKHGRKIKRATRRSRDDGKGQYVGQAQTIALKPEEHVDGRTVGAKLRAHTDPENTVLMTDDSPIYDKVGQSFAEHHSVNHKKEEYVREEDDGTLAHTNTAEGLFANLKRQITGVHHHTSKKHLPRYLEEYDHKYNTRDLTDGERVTKAILGAAGKRVTLFKSKIEGAESLIDRPVPESESVADKKVREGAAEKTKRDAAE